MTPTAIQVGGLGLMVAMLALAQRLGRWEHRPTAVGLCVAVAGLFVAWCFLFFPPWFGCVAAAIVWSIGLWFIFLRFQKRGAEGNLTVAAVSPSLEQKHIAELNREVFNARAHLADAKNELERMQDAERRRTIEACDLAERSEKIWSLKRHAREIRRRWPNSDFAWYPAAKALWVNPAAVPAGLTDSDNNREWVADAIRWHDEFRAYTFVVGHDESYSNSLEFDELMEHLDSEERARGGIIEASLPANRPTVVAEYGIKSSGSGNHGFYIWNLNLRAAFDVRIAPLRLGNRRVFFVGRVAVLDRDHGKTFMELTVSEPGGTMVGADLYTVIDTWRKQADYWAFPLLLRIVYRDNDASWYMTTCLLETDPNDRDSNFVVCRPRTATEESLGFLKG